MEKSYKPYHILFFILACLILLGLVVYFVPSGKQDVLGYEFRFLSKNKLLKEDQRHKIDVDSLIATVDTTIVEDLSVDSLGTHKPKNYQHTVNELITFNDVGKENFITFFGKLRKLSNKKARILHYGDSQIEGDRVTGFLRQRLQSQFGGYGPGFISAINVYNTISFVQEHSENFKRFTNFGGKELSTKRYGILNSVGRFTPEYFQDSTVLIDSLKVSKGWISIAPGTKTYERTKGYKHVVMHYSDAFVPCLLDIYRNGELIQSDTLIADGKYHKIKVDIQEHPEEIKFEFKAKVSPNILGFSLDGNTGIQVDNIAMRGSSGTFFGKIDQSLAKQIYDEQNVEMFIMQFGGNSIPYIKDTASAERSVNFFKGQLNVIKRLRPDAMILVIGPSDMSTLIDGEYTTYPLLPLVVNLIKKASHEVGGAYFDMYQAMGGKDAMVVWVENGLAAEDYVHFTTEGGKLATQKFYDAFMTVYDRLMKEKEQKVKSENLKK
ncbi:MAG: hypothetical protein WC994_07370 [Brumimicrobium sp.]